MFMFGLKVVSSPLCLATEVTWRVERHHTRKRRRNWRVVRHTEQKPCAYKTADGTVIMHPTLYARLKEHLPGQIGSMHAD